MTKYFHMLSPTTQRRVRKFDAMRRAVGEDRFEEWLDKRVARRHVVATFREPDCKPAPYSFFASGSWYVQATWVVDGRSQTYTGRARPTLAEAFQAFYERNPELVDKMHAKLRAKGYDEFGELLP